MKLRIDYLAQLRNKVIEPLWGPKTEEENTFFDYT